MTYYSDVTTIFVTTKKVKASFTIDKYLAFLANEIFAMRYATFNVIGWVKSKMIYYFRTAIPNLSLLAYPKQKKENAPTP